jgi:hypothetical protein
VDRRQNDVRTCFAPWRLVELSSAPDVGKLPGQRHFADRFRRHIRGRALGLASYFLNHTGLTVTSSDNLEQAARRLRENLEDYAGVGQAVARFL